MARTARIVLPGYPHHVVQRSRGGEAVFAERDDYQAYLERLALSANEYGVAIYAYCLLPDSVHLVVVPRTAEGLALAIRRTHSTFSRLYNTKHGGAGTVWKDRFESCPVEKSRVLDIVRYVERLPVLRTPARKAERYEWSSAAAHAGKRVRSVVTEAWPPKGEVKDWGAFLKEKQPAELLAEIEVATARGRPFGSAAFLTRVEKKVGRPVRAQRVGRPRSTA